MSVSVFNLSSTDLKTCWIVQANSCRILIECDLDLSQSLLNETPELFTSYLKEAATSSKSKRAKIERTVKLEQDEDVRVDHLVTPLKLPFADMVDIRTIDYVFLSNSSCALGLPLLAADPAFRGTILATTPTIDIAAELMKELCVLYSQRGCSSLCYSQEDVAACVQSVRRVSYKECVQLPGGISLTAHSSGFSMGSSNLMIEASGARVAYLGDSFLRTQVAHATSMSKDGLKGAHLMIASLRGNLPSLPPPESRLNEICRQVASTLNAGGNVLFPCVAVGSIWDLIQLLMPLNASMYVLGPSGAACLGYSNISPDWLNSRLLQRSFVPEDPFPRPNVRFLESLHGERIKSRSIVFASHPSLRLGDASNILQAWASDQKSLLVMTDPNYDTRVLQPFQPLSIRTAFIPLGCGLSVEETASVLIGYSPERVMVPRTHVGKLITTLKGMGGSHIRTMVCPEPGRSVRIPLPAGVCFETALLSSDLVLSQRSCKDYLFSEVSGTLTRSVDGKLPVLKPSHRNSSSLMFGSLNLEKLVQKLVQKKLANIQIEKAENHWRITIPQAEAVIFCEPSATRIQCNEASTRLILAELIQEL